MGNEIAFIGIGTAKSATTTIAKYLSQHPEICISIPQKVLYFNTKNTFWFEDLENWRVHKPKEWYLNHYKHCSVDSIKGEFASIYFSDEGAPRRIKESFPDVKLIVCFRNPVERAYSHYNMVKNYHLFEKRTFRDAISEEEEYVDRGLYFKHLTRYLDLFDREKIHVIRFEDIKDDPQQEMNKVYQFLGVDIPDEASFAEIVENKPKKTKFKFLKKWEFFITRSVSAMGGGFIFKWLKKRGVDKFIHRLYIKNYKYDKMTGEDKKWLYEYFKEDIDGLEKLLGWDLSTWKY